MMGNSHQLFGALCGATWATATGQDATVIFASTLMATAVSHGRASPDIDQTGMWGKVRRVMPGLLSTMMNHRYLAHWWGLPVLAWWGITVQVPAPDDRWPFYALIIGWASHLLGDFIYGAQGGIPFFPWGGPWMGVGLDTDGFTESGKLSIRGRERKVLPYSPLRTAILASLAWVLFAGIPAIPATLTNWWGTATGVVLALGT